MLNPSVDQCFLKGEPGGIKFSPRGNLYFQLIYGIQVTIIFSINAFAGHDCIDRVIVTILEKILSFIFDIFYEGK